MSANLRPPVAGICVVLFVSALSGRTFVAAGAPQASYRALDVALGASKLDEARRLIPENWTAAEQLFVSYLERAYLPKNPKRPDAEARTRAGRLAEVFFRIQEYDFATAVVGVLDTADAVKRQDLVGTTRDFFALLQRSREVVLQRAPDTDLEDLSTEVYGMAARFRSLGFGRGELFTLFALRNVARAPSPDARTFSAVADELADDLSLQMKEPYSDAALAIAERLALPGRQLRMLSATAQRVMASREPENVARAAQQLERARELARSLPPVESYWYPYPTDMPPLAARDTLPALWQAYQLLNRAADARTVVTEAVDLSRPLGVTAEVRTIKEFGSRATRIGDADQATGFYERAITLAERAERWSLVIETVRTAGSATAVPLATRVGFATRAISAAERTGSARDLAEAFVARSQMGMGATAQSFDDLRRAVAAAERYTAESGLVREELRCLRLLAIEHRIRGEYRQAVEVWLQRVQRAELLDSGTQDVKRESYEALVGLYMNKLYEPALARDAAEQVRQSFQGITSPDEIVYFTMGNVSLMLGRPAAALEYFDKALEQSAVERLRSRGLYSGVIAEARARVFEEFGDYEAALRELADAASQGRLATAQVAQARLNALAGDLDQALAHARNAVASRQKSVAGSWMPSTPLNTVGRILVLAGHPDEAVAFVEMSRDVWLQGNSDTPVARRVYLGALANAYVGAGRLDDARALLLTAVDLDRNEPTAETGGLGASLLALGKLEAAADNPAKAVEYLTAARAAVDAFDLDRSWQVERALAQALARTGYPDAADRHYQRAFEALEGLQAWFRPEEFRFRYGEDRDAVYGEHAQLLAELAIASGEPREAVRAFHANERKRAQMLWSLLATGWSRTDPDAWPDQLRRIQEMGSRMSAKLALLAEQRLLPAEKQEAALIDSLEKELKSLQESHARLWSSGAQGQYRFAAPTQLSSSLAAPVQAALGPSRVLVEYLVTEDRSYAFVVSAGGIKVVRLPIGRAALRDRVRHLLAPFHQARTGEVDLTRLEFNTSAAHALYQTIFAPVRPHLGAAANIVVVPDDALNLLPFEALVETAPDSTPRSQVLHGQFADVSFLVRRFDISYLNSSAQLLAAKTDEAPAALKRLFAMANPTGWVTSPAQDDPLKRPLRSGLMDPYLTPLPGAEAEVRRIASYFARDAATIVQGTGATEAAYRKQAGSADVVHFATHAVPSDGQPLYSTLVLAPGKGADGDGFLQAYEVLQTPLRAEIVVLSACETALGAEDWGQGRVGLVTAFEQAGARSVLATLWSIDDPAADLMAAFYGATAEGRSTSAALRQAKLHLMQQRVRIGKVEVSLAHPFFWAPFVLVGAPANPPAGR